MMDRRLAIGEDELVRLGLTQRFLKVDDEVLAEFIRQLLCRVVGGGSVG